MKAIETGVKVSIKELLNFKWNKINLYGRRHIETDEVELDTLYWDKSIRHDGDVYIADAQEIFEASTPYTSMVWEMKRKEGDEGYEEECKLREQNDAEEFEIIIP